MLLFSFKNTHISIFTFNTMQQFKHLYTKQTNFNLKKSIIFCIYCYYILCFIFLGIYGNFMIITLIISNILFIGLVNVCDFINKKTCKMFQKVKCNKISISEKVFQIFSIRYLNFGFLEYRYFFNYYRKVETTKIEDKTQKVRIAHFFITFCANTLVIFSLFFIIVENLS